MQSSTQTDPVLAPVNDSPPSLSHTSSIDLKKKHLHEKLAASGQEQGENSAHHYVPSSLHKWTMLALFCMAEFMDTFIASALFPAINALRTGLHIDDTAITWAFAAYSATFAAFLLISGRVADIYSAKWTFVTGTLIIGAFSLGSAFVQDKVALFILRAFAGIGAALTVPSALSLIIEWFPDPIEQNRGIALFGGFGAIGNVAGVIIGGMFIQWSNWRAIFYFTGALGLALAALGPFIIPQGHRHERTHDSWKRLDLGAVSVITIAIILFVYAVTTGSATGWGDAGVIAPLIISILMAVLFFVYEAKIDPELAALPPRVWFYPNVGILAAVALMPFFWWCSLFFQLLPRFESVYGWNPILSSIRFLPTGVLAFLEAMLSALLFKLGSPKWILLAGFVLQFIATMLLPFADTADKYYSYLIPAFSIGTFGTALIYTTSNVAIFLNTPHEIAGTVGALFNASLQIGIALGVAIIDSITHSVNENRERAGKEAGYTGIAASFWAVLAVNVLLGLCLLIFYRVERPTPSDEEKVAAEKTALSGVGHTDGLSNTPSEQMRQA